MSDPANSPPADGFTTASPDVIAPGEGELIVNLEGFEGPLDLLLGLARDQKVDLRRISMVPVLQRLPDLSVQTWSRGLNESDQSGRKGNKLQ